VRRGRILVVDDEPLLRSGIARTLGTDHDVVLAATGKDGIDRICCGERYDLILCDLMMPEVTGIDVFERMLEIDATQARRIIFVTGGAFSTRAADFLAVTKNLVLEKPFSPHALRSLVASQLAALG
jgi:CheY-like chemotaxis protein